MIKRLKSKIIHLSKNSLRTFLKDKYSKRYISGNGIASICDIVISSKNEFDRIKVQDSLSIFIKSEFLMEFLTEFEDLIQEKLIFAGNSDHNFYSETSEMRKPRRLYLQNLGFIPSVETIRLLPIGLENYEHIRSGFGVMHRPPRKFKYQTKILVPSMSPTNQVRIRILDEVNQCERVEIFKDSKYRSIFAYLRMSKKYKFIVACEGNGMDTHRLWETLYQDSYPILINSIFSNNISSLGLPVLVIDSLTELTNERLLFHIEEFEDYQARNVPLLWLSHWRNEIITTKSGNSQTGN